MEEPFLCGSAEIASVMVLLVEVSVFLQLALRCHLWRLTAVNESHYGRKADLKTYSRGVAICDL